MAGIVVVGAGQAGSSLVAELRKQGHEGDISLVGSEPVPPYQRPPLSKAYLLGDMSLERMFLRPESFYADNNIALRMGAAVNAIDRKRQVVLIDGDEVPYTQLALTTGSVPRKLPPSIGGDLEGVFVVRTLADVDAMADRFQEGARVLIVGGGYIGLEAAAVAAKLGLSVVLVEMADRILQRVAAPETSNYFRELHAANGVEIKEGVGLTRLTGSGHVSGADLSDGSHLDVDFVVVGVGIAPDIELAEAAGLAINDGIAVDAFGRTSDSLVWAAGDCCSFPYRNERLRLESVPNAIDQAECVARNILGAEEEYIPKPWFWSDQYDVKLQIAGLNAGYDRIVTRQGKGRTASFWYYQGDVLLAVDAMNDPRGYMIGKRLIEAGKSADPAVVGDPDADLKALLKA